MRLMPSDVKPFKQNVVALVYDFDGTLIPGAMQQYGVLPALEIEPEVFWRDVRKLRSEQKSEELLVYMREMIRIADFKKLKLGRDQFRQHGAGIEFFSGVETWFDRINEFIETISESGDIEVEHYIVSSGLKEMIEGCRIAGVFKEIFACEFLYDAHGHPEWPGRVISDTSKTQYLYRINKGVLDVNDSINSHMPLSERRVPFDNMIYFGDGDTDVPSMAVVMANGGHAVAVHKPNADSQKCLDLKKAKRIDYFCPADFSDGSQLDELVKRTLSVIVSRIDLRTRIYNLPPIGTV